MVGIISSINQDLLWGLIIKFEKVNFDDEGEKYVFLTFY